MAGDHETSPLNDFDQLNDGERMAHGEQLIGQQVTKISTANHMTTSLTTTSLPPVILKSSVSSLTVPS